MPYSSLSFPAAGRGPYTILGLPYLLTSHLSVTVGGAPAAATFDDLAKTVTLDVSPTAGAEIVVQRTTPRTEAGRLTQFLALASGQAGLTGGMLDTDYRQLLYILLEGRDGVVADPDDDGLGLGSDEQWDAEGLRIENLAEGVSPGDAVVKAQLDEVDAAARPLPVAVLDNDDGLFVVGGEFDDLAPSGCRTALQLGTAATLNVGTAANNIPQFSSDLSPRYPTVSGALIDLTNHAIQTDIARRAKATVVRWSTQTIPSPGIDPGVAGWSQDVGTRMGLAGGWAARVELNNSGDVDGSSISPYRIRITAGTWRIRWLFKPIIPNLNSSTNRISLRLTNNDDTSAQIIYYDLGLHRPPYNDFAGNDYSMLPDSVVLTFSSAADLVFRYGQRFSGGNNFCNFSVLLHKLI